MMNQNMFKFSGWKRILGNICFMIFGVVSTMQQGDELNPVNIFFGLIIGVVFSWISMWMMATLLRWINPSLRKMYKRSFARKAVSCSMVYMLPFAVMAFIAAYFLHWSSTGLFVSSAISAVAVATGAELSKLYEKPKFWNNIVPSVIASGCSMLWLFFITQAAAIPTLISGLLTVAAQ